MKLKRGVPWDKGDIDKYVTKFEQTAREAGFNLDSVQTIDSFTNGIPQKLYKAAVQYDSPQTFEQWKRALLYRQQQYIQMKAKEALNKHEVSPGGGTHANNWQAPRGNWQPRNLPRYHDPNAMDTSAD